MECDRWHVAALLLSRVGYMFLWQELFQALDEDGSGALGPPPTPYPYPLVQVPLIHLKS